MKNTKLQISNKKSWINFTIIILIYLFLQLTIFMNTFLLTDNPLYIYIFKMVSEGSMLYEDFFFAHPPLQPYLYGFVYEIVGYNEFIFRLIPVIGTILMSFFLFKLVKLKFGNIEAILSVLLLLSSKIILYQSSYNYGYFLILPMIIAGLWCFFQNNFFLSGILFGLAAITRLISIPAFGVLMLFSAFAISHKKIILTYKKVLKLLTGFSIIFIPVMLYYSLKFNNFIQYVLGFQLTRGTLTLSQKIQQFFLIINIDLLLFFLPIIFLYYAYSKKLNIILGIIIVYLIFIFSLRNVFKEYFIMIYPFLAIIASVGIISFLNNSFINKNSLKKISLIIIAIFMLVPASKYIYDTYNEVYILSNEELDAVNSLSTYISQNSLPQDLIYGGQPHTAEIALRSGRDIAFNNPVVQLDIYENWYPNGKENLDIFLGNMEKLIDEQKIKFIINTENPSLLHVEKYDEYQELITVKCDNTEIEDLEGKYSLFECF